MSKIRFIIQVTALVPGLVTGQRPPLLVTDIVNVTLMPEIEPPSLKMVSEGSISIERFGEYL